MASPHVHVTENPDAVVHAAQRLFVAAARKAIDEKAIFNVALSGGSTPRLLFRLLAKGIGTVPQEWPFDWSKVQVYFVDERCVPPTHEESNYGMARAELLSRVPIPPSNVHRMRGEVDPSQAAKEYGQLLKDRFGEDGGMDLALLGMGEDGHTASLFPHTPALNETKHRCVAQFVEKSTTGPSWRITLTAPFINRAAEVIVTVTGAGKAARLEEVLDGPRDPQRLPVQLIQPAGKLVWIIDGEANAARAPATPRPDSA